MKESDEKIVQGYLQGKDKVSSAYAELHSEKPSAELDARILQAARKAVKDQTPSKKHIPYQAYSIAASVCLMVLAASLFLNNEEQLIPQSFESQAIPQTDSPPNTNTADNAEVFQGTVLNLETAEDSAVTADATEAQAAASTPQTNQNQLEQPTQDAVAARARREADANAAADEALQENTEVNLAASLEAAPADTSYRENIATWLAEIQRLQAIEPAQAAEEARLFTAAYPEIDLAARLDELNENIEINQ